MILRNALLYFSRSRAVRTLVTQAPVSKAVAARFVAGDRLSDLIMVARGLNARGLEVTADHLGENVTTEAEAAAAANDYLRLLDDIADSGVQSHVSLKLTQFGLDLGDELCAANLRRVAERAKAVGTFVRVDMESTAYTDRTLAIVRAMRRDGFENVGAVIQSYLLRSEADIEALCRDGIRVRLCKGAYDEPPDRAFPSKGDVDSNYIKLTHALLRATAEQPQLYPAFATHDEQMVQAVIRFAQANGVSRADFEFQMLYGIRRELQESLVADGYNVRVYVPYGTEWYPYFMRRLAERPANLWFFVSNFFRG